MLCQNCGSNEAKFHYTSNINGVESELHLCQDCAVKLEYGKFFKTQYNNASNPFFLNILNSSQKPEVDIRQCPRCGATARDLHRTGKVGCADCYDLFADMLLPYIRRIHSRSTHNGKIPKSAGPEYARKRETERLKRELESAVSIQDYERAAQLRDQIKALETQN